MDFRIFAVCVVLFLSCGSEALNFTQLFHFTGFRERIIVLFHKFEQNLNNTYRYLRYNWRLDPVCANENEECNETISCCDEDLTCYPAGANTFKCTNITWINDTLGEDLDKHMTRLNDLAYDINYRDWANSFEFESRSTMKREEDTAREERLWKEKHKNDMLEEQKWLPLLKKLVEKSKQKWKEIQKLKKLKEVKDILKEKIASRKHIDSLPSDENAMPEVEERTEKTKVENKIISKEQKSNEEEKTKTETENGDNEDVGESLIEDSKESRKKDYPGLDQLLRDADDVVKEHKAQEEKQNTDERTSSENRRSKEIAQIEDTEDKLEEELKRLKELQKQEKQAKVEADTNMANAFDGTNPDEIKELIKKQVALILEQERKLSSMMKLSELERMKENLKEQAAKAP